MCPLFQNRSPLLVRISDTGAICQTQHSPEHSKEGTTLFMRIFASSQVSSASTMHTVSLRFLPLICTVSPRKSESSCIVLRCRDTTLLSSLTASSTIRRFGFFFLSFGSSLHHHTNGASCGSEFEHTCLSRRHSKSNRVKWRSAHTFLKFQAKHSQCHGHRLCLVHASLTQAHV